MARRQTAFKACATTCVEFEPHNFQQAAGLAAFYNTDCFYYLFITRADHAEKCLGIMACEHGNAWYPIEKDFPLTSWKRVYLKCELDDLRLVFFYSPGGKEWTRTGSEVYASILSDEHVPPGGFSGNMPVLAWHDMTGSKHHADFDLFDC